MSLLKFFLSFIIKENLFQEKDKLILAVSGGVDSTVLCQLCHQAGYNFSIAHCNFQLRGAESTRDEIFVRSLSEKYGVTLFTKKFDTQNFADVHKLSIQVAARELRYSWFKELVIELDKQSANVIAGTHNVVHRTAHILHKTFLLTAHHANDNIETLLMNFFRGTGIAGLKGILPKQQHLIRPLLFATRQQLIGYAAENELTYVEDSSNLTDKYTRNYFRNQLIPSIEKVFPKAEANLIDNLQRFRDIEMLYNESISIRKKKLLEHKGGEIHIPVLKLLKAQPLFTLVYEIIKDFSFNPGQVNDVISLLHSETGKYVQSGSHKIIKNRHWLIIAPNDTVLAQNILIGETDATIFFESGELKLEKKAAVNYTLSTVNSIAALDAKDIVFPLLLRMWKQGDYFYPLGMNKKKKLSRFFTDQKMSLSEKEKIWVVEMDKKILWVVGKRIDDRFKITVRTKDILQLSLC